MKNLKKLVAVLLAVMLLGALAACGGDTKTDQPTSGGDSQQGGNQILETGLKQVAELEIVAGAEEPATLEISQLTEAADNAVLADFNTDIQAKLTEWQQSLMDGETLLVRACVLDTENYLSVLLTKEVTPNYGSDAEVYYYVYDRIVDNKMDVEYAKAWMSLSEDALADAVNAYMEEGQKWVSFNADAFYVDTDEKAVFLVSCKVRQEGADDWTYVYVLKDGKIVGNITQLMGQIKQ